MCFDPCAVCDRTGASRCLAVVLVALAWAGGGAVLAQSVLTPRITRFEVVDDRFPEMSARFSVRASSADRRRLPAVDRVIVKEDGVEIAADFRRMPERGTAFAIALDASGSMRPVFPDVKRAVGAFLAGHSKEDRFTLLSFHDEVEYFGGFTGSAEGLQESLEGLRRGGRFTELFWGVVQAVESFQGVDLPAHKVVLVISDGRDEGLSYSLDDVIEHAQKRGVEIWGFGLSGDDPRPLLNLYRMAAATDGQFLRVEAGEDPVEKMLVLGEMVDQDWSVTWRSTLPKDGEEHLADLLVSFGSAGAAYESTLIETPGQEPGSSQQLNGVLLARWWLEAVVALAALLALGIVFLVARTKVSARGIPKELPSGPWPPSGEEGSVAAPASAPGQGRLEESIELIPEAIAAPRTASRRRTRFVPSPADARVGDSMSVSLLDGPFVEVQGGTSPRARVPLRGGGISIGRDPDNGLVLDEPRVSGQHAVITRSGTGWRLEDLGSTNGTVVGGVRITEPVNLVPGAEIRLGGYVLLFHDRVPERDGKGQRS